MTQTENTHIPQKRTTFSENNSEKPSKKKCMALSVRKKITQA